MYLTKSFFYGIITAGLLSVGMTGCFDGKDSNNLGNVKHISPSNDTSTTIENQWNFDPSHPNNIKNLKFIEYVHNNIFIPMIKNSDKKTQATYKSYRIPDHKVKVKFNDIVYFAKDISMREYIYAIRYRDNFYKFVYITDEETFNETLDRTLMGGLVDERTNRILVTRVGNWMIYYKKFGKTDTASNLDTFDVNQLDILKTYFREYK